MSTTNKSLYTMPALTPAEQEIIIHKGTERAGTGEYRKSA